MMLIRITHPQIASDAKIFLLAMRSPLMLRENSRQSGREQRGWSTLPRRSLNDALPNPPWEFTNIRVYVMVCVFVFVSLV